MTSMSSCSGIRILRQVDLEQHPNLRIATGCFEEGSTGSTLETVSKSSDVVLRLPNWQWPCDDHCQLTCYGCRSLAIAATSTSFMQATTAMIFRSSQFLQPSDVGSVSGSFVYVLPKESRIPTTEYVSATCVELFSCGVVARAERVSGGVRLGRGMMGSPPGPPKRPQV